MKRKIKLGSMILLVLMFIGFSGNISYGTGMTSNPQIKTRGLVFNKGVASDQVRLLKDFFRVKGMSNVPWGYHYDNRTKELVRQYQRANDLIADGIAGPATINTINKEIKSKKLNVGLRIISTDIRGDMIVINKSSNTLYFLRNGIIQNSYPVATGKTNYLTPNGRFKVAMKLVNPAWGGAGISDPIPGGAPNNPLGKRWIGLSHGGGGKYGVHGNANPGSIGTYASLGCVRMFNSDVVNLYGKVNMGIPIWIGPESTLESYGVKFKSNYKKPALKPPVKDEIIKQKVNIRLDGKKITLKNDVLNKKGTTYYPFREVLELVDAEVLWDDENRKATGILGDNIVEFTLGENKYKNNGISKDLPKGQKVFAKEGKSYIPIRNVMEGLGYEVEWEQSTSTIIINQKINIKLDGKDIELENTVINKKGTTYYPFREVLELVDAEVLWDDENRKATGILGDNIVEFTLGENKYKNNGISKDLPKGQKVFAKEGKSYIPIRNVMEGLGYEVKWVLSNRTIIINSIVQEKPEDQEEIKKDEKPLEEKDEEEIQLPKEDEIKKNIPSLEEEKNKEDNKPLEENKKKKDNQPEEENRNSEEINLENDI